MQIDIWSDIACPFCYIGKRHLEAALAEAGVEAEVIWRSFELDPSTPREAGEEDIIALLMKKYGQGRAQTEAMVERVAAMGAAAGLRLRFRDVVRVNTFDAHRLLHLAAEAGRQDAAKERLLAAYFTEGADLGDRETLAALMAEVGLNAEAVMAVLDSDRFAAEVRRDEQVAMQIGVRGVPFFVFNRRHAVSGAQPVSTFRQLLRQVQAEAALAAAAADAETCGPDSCEV